MTARINQTEFRLLSALVAKREKALGAAQEKLEAARREQAARCAEWEAAKVQLRKLVQDASGVRVWP